MGPGRGGGGSVCSGDTGLDGMDGVEGGDRKLAVLDDTGLAIDDVDPFVIGKRSG